MCIQGSNLYTSVHPCLKSYEYKVCEETQTFFSRSQAYIFHHGQDIFAEFT